MPSRNERCRAFVSRGGVLCSSAVLMRRGAQLRTSLYSRITQTKEHDKPKHLGRKGTGFVGAGELPSSDEEEEEKL